MDTGRPRELDGRLALELWQKYTSTEAMKRYNQIASEKGEKTTTHWTSITRAAKTSVLERQKESREFLISLDPVKWSNDYTWYHTLVSWAFHVYTNSAGGFVKWIMSEENEKLRSTWPFIYESRFRTKFGISIEDFQEQMRNMPKTRRKRPRTRAKIKKPEKMESVG